ncbi:hydroxyacid dehydrogenase homolog [Seminavis robusta]|uniref:Hydroxyacid dehydrogenase homolog n=1 Tax=Seminavis robusta TaxID=568900 RepID=A0A9N8HUP4_9STRA|nr:hydroxyacid dehydrogenase homolog [Seminavis robusta]|eukprot:Sro1681_g290830.1 hydroxyacid dehydrogenase homolog (549) ;mRNA; f:12878-14621
MSNQAAAIKILKSTTWFSKCSNELITALAAKLELLDVGEGHVFISEGLPMDKSMILESGSLFRTKMHVVDDLVEEEGGHNKRRASLSQSLRNMKAAEVSSTIQENAVVVDIVQGHGHVTGLLHIFSEDSCAFATVTSKTPAKVWIMSAKDFREILSSNPAFMLDIMGNMATELRTGGKSLRAVMSQLHSKGLGGDAKENEKETLRVLCYDTTSWVSDAFQPAVKAFNADPKNSFQMMVDFTTERLGPQSATYSAGYEAICTFVNDTADAGTIQTLSRLGVNMIAQRAAGFDRVDTKAARAYGMTVARVPAYSPYAVAEMAIALLMAVNRKTTKASSRVKMANFSLDAGLLGVDIHGKTVGVMGTGKIGQILCNIILGFGAKLICYDVFQNEAVKQAGGVYVTKDEIFAQSDILFFMMPLLPATRHTLNMDTLPKLKKGVMLINTSRGGLVDTKALLQGLRTGVISGCGMDVYENEQEYFFQDWSAKSIQDPDLTALLGEPGVVMTAHQAFFTKEAVDKITQTTMENLRDFKLGKCEFDHPNNCIPKDD